MIYEDARVLVFLNRYPTQRGYTLVCPRRHVVGDLAEAEYLRLQQWVFRVGRAVQQVVPTERLYVLSLGSQQGNRHVHWHVAPLPPGVPYAEQQLAP
jgi:diadenosine tetraphosphate (Ap4A) HIT family hydrolase